MAALMDRRAAALAAILCVLLSLEGCERPKTAEAKKTTAASKVEKLPGEADLTTIHLNEEADSTRRPSATSASPPRRSRASRWRGYGRTAAR
jgi:hypothetical protein